jgi:hypothetical protein
MVGSDFRAGRRGRPFRLQWRDRAGFPPASTAIGDSSYGRLLILVNHLPRLSKLLGRTNSQSCPRRLHHEMRSCATKIRQLLIAVPPKRFCSTRGKVLPAETDDLKILACFDVWPMCPDDRACEEIPILRGIRWLCSRWLRDDFIPDPKLSERGTGKLDLFCSFASQRRICTRRRHPRFVGICSIQRLCRCSGYRERRTR